MFSSLVWLAAALFAQDPPASSPLVGIYQGRVEVGGAALRLALHVAPKEGGALDVKLDLLDQKTLGVAASTVEARGRRMDVAWEAMRITMGCVLADDGQALDVNFKQGPADTNARLKRVAAVELAKHPQEPKPPFPYATEDVKFLSSNDVVLAGTLTMPKGDGPFRAVVLLGDAGPQNRDAEVSGHKPFLVLADHLTRNGIAVLRYDDRGTAQSSGDFGSATTFDFTDDALAAVAFLKKRPRIDPKRIGIAGHGEGGVIAPLAATMSKDVAFVVLLAGPGLPGDVMLRLQTALVARADGASESDIAHTAAIYERLCAVVKSEPSGPQVAEKLLAIIEEARQRADSDAERNFQAQIALVATQISTPSFKAYLMYDPRKTLRRVNCPVLALIGQKDLQIPPRENLPEIEKALHEAGNEHVTIREMPGLNHVFQPCKSGLQSEYASIETTLNADVLDAVTTFVIGIN